MNQVSVGADVSHHSSHDTHPKNLQHHFTDVEQQFDAAKMGMWLFLLTEILLFGGLFVGYALYHSIHPEMFKSAHQLLDWKMGAINTVVLILSSIAVALGIRSVQVNKNQAAINFFGASLFFAALFLFIKFLEYSHKIELGILPGHFYSYTGAEGAIVGENPHIFFSFYYAMTGIHGLHVLIGMGLILWMIVGLVKRKYNAEYYTPVELTGLYWNMVELIWFFLFPVLYLIG